MMKASDRVLVVAAHPDDEILGAGGMLQKALLAGAAVRVVYLTHGDRNMLAGLFHMRKPLLTKKTKLQIGLQRKKEAVLAMKRLGAGPEALEFLGFPDGKLLSLWKKDRRRSPVVVQLRRVLRDFHPTHIFAPADFDRHPDHKAAAHFVQAAVSGEPGNPPAVIFSYLIHHGRWPAPKRFMPEAFLVPPKKWAKKSEWLLVRMTEEELRKKYKALLAYKSQMSYSRNFLLSFARSNELFYTKTSGLNPAKTL